MTIPKHVHTDKSFIEAIIKKYDLQNCKPVKIGDSWQLKAYWTDKEADGFCALFGVSGHSSVAGRWHFTHLKGQPYNPQMKF